MSQLEKIIDMITKTKISKRELEVLELISLEYTSDEIARKLYISNHTALSHRKSLLSKMGVRNTAGLIRKAFEYQLFTFCLPLICSILLIPGVMIGQNIQLDVEGDVKVRGNIDIHDAEDSTSVYIGAKSGANIINSIITKKNTFVGFKAGFSNEDGGSNSFFGSDAGKDNTTGDHNSFFGTRAGQLNSLGRSNSFFGYQAGEDNTSGDSNTLIGSSSGKRNVSGDENTFIGQASGERNINGHLNTFVGRAAGAKNISGHHNTFLGYSTGQDNTTGSRNTLLGAFTKVDTTVKQGQINESIAIGHMAMVACDYCAVIGGTGSDAVNVGIGTTTPAALMHIEGMDSDELTLRDTGNVVNIKLVTATGLLEDNWQVTAKSGSIGNSSEASIIFQYGQDSLFRIRGNGNATLAGTLTENSDSRLKTNISILNSVLLQLLTLNAYSYDWKDQTLSDQRQIGLMAQEVLEVFPDLVQEDLSGKLSIGYTRFIPILIEAIREQQAIISEQNENYLSLLKRVKDLEEISRDQ